MPLYEYHCEDCDKKFEKMVRFSEDPNLPQECPECHSSRTRKLITTFAARLSTALFGDGSSSGSCGSSGGFS